MNPLKQTPLAERHVAAGAKMADFGGWEMPIEYTGVVTEHSAVRTAVGIFDVSHMGKVRIHGPGAANFLNGLLTNDLDRIASGQAQYTMMCNEAGGVIDDLIVYRWADDDIFMVPNASNAPSVVAVLQNVAPAGVEIVDLHNDLGIIAVQGPSSKALIESMGMPADHDYMTMAESRFRGEAVTVCRTGYTGEHGYELVAPVSVLVELWDALLARRDEFGVVRAGLGARDTLRTEMGYPLHGQDLSLDISPVQAGLIWAVGWDKPEFTGRAALLAERTVGPRRRLRGLKSMDRGIPRPHMEVRRVAAEVFAGAVIGEVTSGTFSPTLKQGVALALLDPSVNIGDEVVVDVRGRELKFTVTKPPFVEPSTRT
ncbi:MAG: glycine cleavage system aminomethyltransferase GcvT [Actinomycetota bacterium]|nr:glycine cleavage system aminomethyltransferase GcvT [Actinomycetota bacterium]